MNFLKYRMNLRMSRTNHDELFEMETAGTKPCRIKNESVQA